jgi:hypothetical protein
MERENGHHDLLLGEEVASSTPHLAPSPNQGGGACYTTGTAERASMVQSQPAPNKLLVAARELLRNPPGEAALPDAQRQWRDDIDRLLNLAQVSPGSAGASASSSTVVKVVHPALCTLHQ